MNSIWVGTEHIMESGDFSTFSDNGDYRSVCPESLYGGSLVQKTHPVPGRSSDPCVESGFGMWNEKIYHFLPDKPPSSDGDEIQSEFFVKFEDMPTAVADLYSHADKFRDHV